LINVKNLTIDIIGNDCGSAPISIVDFALGKQNEYERIFCVFDKDTHPSYKEAIDKIKRARLKSGHSLQAMDSIPCFEYWMLLHFEYTTTPFSASGKKSVCDALIQRKLSKHIPDYTKGRKETIQTLIPNIDKAIQHAKKVEAYHRTSKTDNPSTRVYILVDYLRNIKK
jgi:hypothetical protein